MFEYIEERLIIAVDYDTEGTVNHREEAIHHLQHVCDTLLPYAEKGLTLKVNSLARLIGATAIETIHDAGFPCFLDLKLFDIEKTLLRDVSWIRDFAPAMLTVHTGVKSVAFKAVQQLLPQTLVLAVDPLTDLTDDDFAEHGSTDRSTYVKTYFNKVWRLKARGTICSPRDIEVAASPGFKSRTIFITPDIRPVWSKTPTDVIHSFTPSEAIKAGAQAIVVGGRITSQPDMRGAVERTLEEIASALSG